MVVSRDNWLRRPHCPNQDTAELYQLVQTFADHLNTLSRTALLSLQELLVFDDPPKFMVHVHGMGQLIQLRGPHKFMYGIDHQTFKWFRTFGVSIVDSWSHVMQ